MGQACIRLEVCQSTEFLVGDKHDRDYGTVRHVLRTSDSHSIRGVLATRKYEMVPGFFVQDDPDQPQVESFPEEILPRLGLVDKSLNRWETFTTAIRRLNVTAPRGVQYKVFFLGRHGQGLHNVAEAKYGSKAWNEYWSKLNGDGEIVWGPDPELTLLGEQQARDAHSAWEFERRFGVPLPEKSYTSPLARAIRTNQVTFDGFGLETTIVESLREQHGVHTCDKRRTRLEIHGAFPEYIFEDEFADSDPLWKPDYRETHADVNCRVTSVLDKIFRDDSEQFISITTHGGFVGGFLRVCHHRPWRLPTGGILPIVVKGSMIGEE